MSDIVRLDIPVLLPEIAEDGDQCLNRLERTLRGAEGLDEVHVVRSDDGSPSRLCLHIDRSITSVAAVQRAARSAGAEITSRFGHVVWDVSGVTHARRARSVAEALRRRPGVVDAEVTVALARIEFDRQSIDERQLRSVLDGLGVSVETQPSEQTQPSKDEQAADAQRAETEQEPRDDAGEGHGDDHAHNGPFGERSELIFAAASGVLWVAGFAAELAGLFSDSTLTVVFIAAGLFGGFFTVREAIQGIRNGRFEIDFLMLVAAGGAALLRRWEEGALLLALFSIGHAMEGYAMGRARRAIEALSDLAPPTAIVRRDGQETEVPVEELLVGDVVVVKPNERIAADGFVLSGTSSIDESSLTGESIPVDKEPVEDQDRAAERPTDVRKESRLFAGTINGGGQIDLQVTRLARDTTLSQMAEMVREAETNASPTQRFTDRFERVFVPSVIVLAVVVLVGGPILGSSWSESFYRSMAVLVAASPCALAIATPSAVLAAVARAGRLGVLIKGGGPLENLGRLRAVAFDKTGTLTEGRPRLTDVVAADGSSTDELLRTAVAVERRSDHPLADAVVRDGLERLGTDDVPAALDVRSITGRGVSGSVDGDEVFIGNAELFDERGGLDAAVRRDADELLRQGRTIMIVERGSRVLGVIGLMDTARDGAAQMINNLRGMGVDRAIMISGDHQLVADSIAAEIGLTEAWGNLMPNDKVDAIQRLREEEGMVAMVGDGVNDAPAMATATVGIAMGAAGSDVALETADVALMGDKLSMLPVVIGLSRRASRIIKQNLYLSLGIVAILIPATIFGVVGIGPAVVFHEGSTLVVVANALRLLRYEYR